MNTNDAVARGRLRVWPAAILAALWAVAEFVLPKIFPDAGFTWFFATLIIAAAMLLWWLLFSRAPWAERLVTIALMAVALLATFQIVHFSVTGAGQGMLFGFMATPMLVFAVTVAVLLTQRFGDGVRRSAMGAAILLVCTGWAMIRVEGIRGSSGMDFAWRWTPTPEEKLLEQARNEPLAAPAPAPAAPESAPAAAPVASAPAAGAEKAAAAEPAAASAPAEWPGFRGPNRDSVAPAVPINSDWAASPPVEMWRRNVGPGWSSFAVHSNRLYTQEQRGEEEVVACYDLKTGKPVWLHRDSTRFWEANAGAGPRGTPTVHSGRVYAFGATGILNALDAATGAVIWSRNAGSDSGVKTPTWGFASSPLVVDDVVVVAASGKLLAYDAATGTPRWTGPAGKGSYSSPHLLTIDGVAQVALLSGSGAISVAPADGKLLWEHKWETGGVTMVQPTLLSDGEILVTANGMGGGEGMRRLSVTREGDQWKVVERWTSRGLKPYFNDLVVHEGHAYGFDGSILSCIDLSTGERKWKGGRYGNGQMVLLPQQDLLLVISEDGEIALVRATPDQYTEVAKVAAIEGKTWNHPAVVGDVLLVRNDREMAAFRLPKARSGD